MMANKINLLRNLSSSLWTSDVISTTYKLTSSKDWTITCQEWDRYSKRKYYGLLQTNVYRDIKLTVMNLKMYLYKACFSVPETSETLEGWGIEGYFYCTQVPPKAYEGPGREAAISQPRLRLRSSTVPFSVQKSHLLRRSRKGISILSNHRYRDHSHHSLEYRLDWRGNYDRRSLKTKNKKPQ